MPRLIPLIAAAAAILLAASAGHAQYGPAGGSPSPQPAPQPRPQPGGGNDIDDAQPNQPGLPMIFAGDGVAIDIRAVDANTGTFSGTLTLPNMPVMQYRAKIQVDQNGYQKGVGEVQTAAGPKPVGIVDESDTVARITFEGKTYRVVKGATLKPQEPAKSDARPADDSPKPAAGGGAAPAQFGVGVKPHDAMPGWRVTEVDAGGIADKAGIKVDDVILDAKDADGRGVAIQPSLGFDPLRGVLKGDKFTLTILRQNAQPPLLEIKVERPAQGGQAGERPTTPRGGPTRGRSPSPPNRS